MKERRSRTRIAVYLIVGALVAFGESVILPEAFDVQPGKSAEQAWVVAHASELPTTLDEIGAFPLYYRNQILRALPPGTKSRLWREQLTLALRNETFNDEQRASITKVMGALTPELFASKGNPKAGSPVFEFCRFAKGQFSEQQRRIFSVIGKGPDQGSYRNPQVARLLIANKIRDTFVVNANNPDCYCNIGSWCDCDTDCNCKGGPCHPSAPGCGCFAVWECDGWCYCG